MVGRKTPPKSEHFEKENGDFRMKTIINFLRDERGMQTAEYMIMGTVMAAGSVVAVKGVKDGSDVKLGQMKDALDIDVNGNLGG